MKVPFFKHSLGDEEKNALISALDRDFLTTSTITEEFEKLFSKYLQINHCIAVTSASQGLFLALKYFAVNNQDQYVIVPDMTFLASSSVVEEAGGQSILVDCRLESGLIDIDKVEETIINFNEKNKGSSKRICGIIPVHLYGQMVDMNRLKKISQKYGLFIIEDCAHCIEGTRDNISPGKMGDVAVFSFYATKNITSGEGGAICTNNNEMSMWLKKARNHGVNKTASDRFENRIPFYDMEFLGYKCNLCDILSSILIPQIAKIEKQLKRREEISLIYEKELESYVDLFSNEAHNIRHARHLFPIIIRDNKRDKIYNHLAENNIGTTINYKPVHSNTYYKNKYGSSFDENINSIYIGNNVLSLPLYPSLKEIEQSYVIDKIKENL